MWSEHAVRGERKVTVANWLLAAATTNPQHSPILFSQEIIVQPLALNWQANTSPFFHLNLYFFSSIN